jgi:hypothetical protein
MLSQSPSHNCSSQVQVLYVRVQVSKPSSQVRVTKYTDSSPRTRTLPTSWLSGVHQHHHRQDYGDEKRKTLQDHKHQVVQQVRVWCTRHELDGQLVGTCSYSAWSLAITRWTYYKGLIIIPQNRQARSLLSLLTSSALFCPSVSNCMQLGGLGALVVSTHSGVPAAPTAVERMHF